MALKTGLPSSLTIQCLQFLVVQKYDRILIRLRTRMLGDAEFHAPLSGDSGGFFERESGI